MKSAYKKGAAARINGIRKSANPYLYMTNLWSCWMAGWNDQDMVAQ